MFSLTHAEEQEFYRCLKPYLYDEPVLRMRNYCQHGAVSTYTHCLRVARLGFWLNHRLALHGNDRDLCIGALLHDFFLYDWHDRTATDWRHSYLHAGRALRNADRYYALNERTRGIIASHMWPIRPTVLPQSREAWTIAVADKLCSLDETLFARDPDRRRHRL